MLGNIAALVAIATLGTGCGGGDQSAGGPGGGGGGGMPPMPVETAEAYATGMADEFTVIGSLEAEYEIEVVAEIAGRVLELPFEEGGNVEAGDRLARLDDAQPLAEVQRAEALVQQRRVTYERVRTVVEQRAGAPQDLDDAAANLAIAEADRDLARARLAKTRIDAPFAGIVGARRVSPGAYLSAGDPITELAQVDRLRATFAAPEIYLGKIVPGAEVSVRTSAFPDLMVTGTVDVVEPVLDLGSRSARVVARIDNPGGKLRPGMSAEISVVLDSRPDAVTVPAEAVFFQGQQAFVYTVAADSTVAMAPVGLGTRGKTLVEITRGLTSGQTVVRAGHQKLFPGARVMPVAEGGPGGAGPGGADPDGTGPDGGDEGGSEADGGSGPGASS
jgi:membrane fusion protein (multidrug efflux system)